MSVFKNDLQVGSYFSSRYQLDKEVRAFSLQTYETGVEDQVVQQCVFTVL